MNRNIKTLTKILIILLVIMSALFILPKATFALDERSDNDLVIRSKGLSNDSNNKTLAQLKQGQKIYLGGSWDKNNNIFCNSRVYCIQVGTTVDYNGNYELAYEYDVDDDSIDIKGYNGHTVNNSSVTNSNNVNFAKGIISILSHAEDERWNYDPTNGGGQFRIH